MALMTALLVPEADDAGGGHAEEETAATARTIATQASSAQTQARTNPISRRARIMSNGRSPGTAGLASSGITSSRPRSVRSTGAGPQKNALGCAGVWGHGGSEDWKGTSDGLWGWLVSAWGAAGFACGFGGDRYGDSDDGGREDGNRGSAVHAFRWLQSGHDPGNEHGQRDLLCRAEGGRDHFLVVPRRCHARSPG